MKPPKEVVILGKWYQIKGNLDAEDEMYGTCKPKYCLIQYHPDMHHAQLRDTIWHEILHAIYCETGLSAQISSKDEDDPTEEQLVQRSATAELQVLRENPELAAYLIEGED